MRKVEAKVSLVSDIQAGFAFVGVGENKFARIALQICAHKLSQAASRDHKTPPVFGKAEPVGALDFVHRQKRLKPVSITFALETGVPHMDFAREERESRIETSIHEAN